MAASHQTTLHLIRDAFWLTGQILPNNSLYRQLLLHLESGRDSKRTSSTGLSRRTSSWPENAFVLELLCALDRLGWDLDTPLEEVFHHTTTGPNTLRSVDGILRKRAQAYAATVSDAPGCGKDKRSSDFVYPYDTIFSQEELSSKMCTLPINDVAATMQLDNDVWWNGHISFLKAKYIVQQAAHVWQSAWQHVEATCGQFFVDTRIHDRQTSFTADRPAAVYARATTVHISTIKRQLNVETLFDVRYNIAWSTYERRLRESAVEMSGLWKTYFALPGGDCGHMSVRRHASATRRQLLHLRSGRRRRHASDGDGEHPMPLKGLDPEVDIRACEKVLTVASSLLRYTWTLLLGAEVVSEVNRRAESLILWLRTIFWSPRPSQMRLDTATVAGPTEAPVLLSVELLRILSRDGDTFLHEAPENIDDQTLYVNSDRERDLIHKIEAAAKISIIIHFIQRRTRHSSSSSVELADLPPVGPDQWTTVDSDIVGFVQRLVNALGVLNQQLQEDSGVVSDFRTTFCRPRQHTGTGDGRPPPVRWRFSAQSAGHLLTLRPQLKWLLGVISQAQATMRRSEEQCISTHTSFFIQGIIEFVYSPHLGLENEAEAAVPGLAEEVKRRCKRGWFMYAILRKTEKLVYANVETICSILRLLQDDPTSADVPFICAPEESPPTSIDPCSPHSLCDTSDVYVRGLRAWVEEKLRTTLPRDVIYASAQKPTREQTGDVEMQLDRVSHVVMTDLRHEVELLRYRSSETSILVPTEVRDYLRKQVRTLWDVWRLESPSLTVPCPLDGSTFLDPTMADIWQYIQQRAQNELTGDDAWKTRLSSVPLLLHLFVGSTLCSVIRQEEQDV